MVLLPISREGKPPQSRTHQHSSAQEGLTGFPVTLRVSSGTSGPLASHHLHAGFEHYGCAQMVGHEIQAPRERQGAGPMPESCSPAWREQPGAFPVFCTPHLSPMEGRSPAWKCADSFQSCKTKLFHPKDSGCSASCPSASLNSDQISH